MQFLHEQYGSSGSLPLPVHVYIVYIVSGCQCVRGEIGGNTQLFQKCPGISSYVLRSSALSQVRGFQIM